jgi:beta-phosphoglucomutase-like phosphatase (HAD superfamily)
VGQGSARRGHRLAGCPLSSPAAVIFDLDGVEDSSNGLRSAAAGMGVVAIPNAAFPPETDALDLAGAVLSSIGELEPQVIEDAAPRR